MRPDNGAIIGYEAKLWRMADALRGSMDAAEYKHVVLGLIFLKYISDAFEEQHARLEAERAQGADPEDPDEYSTINIFCVPPEARWKHIKPQAKQPTIGQLVDDAMAGLDRDNQALKCVLPKDYARVTPTVGIDSTFFYYLLRYLKPHFVCIARNKQTTGLEHVTKLDIENIEVAYPAFPEHRAIAHILGTLDEKIELNRRMSETQGQMARATFKSWFVDFEPVRAKMESRWRRSQSLSGLPVHLYDLFPDRLVDSELGEIPEEWEWEAVSLPDLVEINPPRLLRKGEIVPYLDMANMPTRGHTPDEVVERPFGSGMRFINGDTLVVRITPCLENGKTAFVDFLQDGQVGGARPSTLCCAQSLRYLRSSPIVWLEAMPSVNLLSRA